MRQFGAIVTRMSADRTPSEQKRAIGLRLRDFRKAQGLRPMEVAVALGCTQQNYEFYEAGRNIIGSDRLREFAAALRTDPHTLHDILYPVEPLSVTEKREGFEVPAGTSDKVDIGRVILRKLHPSQGSLVRLATP